MCYVLSIDIGIHHLALVLTKIRDDWTIWDVMETKLIDITLMKHEKVDIIECELFHTKTMTDWMEHVFQEESELFDIADHILIERQPPQGFVSIEQLIFSKFRKKSHLVHPIAVSTFVSSSNRYCDYEERKEKSIEFANTILKKLDKIDCINMGWKRKHDIADAICMMAYWVYQKQMEFKERCRRTKYKSVEITTSVENWFEQHRYKPK